MSKIAENMNKIVLGVAGIAGAIAAITAILTTAFEWDVAKVTAIVSIVVILAFAVGYAIDRAINRINQNLDKRLVGIKEDIAKNEAAAQERSRAHDLALCRLELSDLMNNDPDNTVAIRKKARHYFCELNGNDGMSDRYSTWSRKYDNGDLSLLNCEKQEKI